MAAVNPYRRWRKAVYLAGVVVVCLLTAAALLVLLTMLIGFLPGTGSGTS